MKAKGVHVVSPMGFGCTVLTIRDEYTIIDLYLLCVSSRDFLFCLCKFVCSYVNKIENELKILKNNFFDNNLKFKLMN